MLNKQLWQKIIVVGYYHVEQGWIIMLVSDEQQGSTWLKSDGPWWCDEAIVINLTVTVKSLIKMTVTVSTEVKINRVTGPLFFDDRRQEHFFSLEVTVSILIKWDTSKIILDGNGEFV